MFARSKHLLVCLMQFMSHNFVNKVHTFFASTVCHFSSLPLFSKESTLKGKNSLWKVFVALGNKEEVTSVVSFEQEGHDGPVSLT